MRREERLPLGVQKDREASIPQLPPRIRLVMLSVRQVFSVKVPV